MKESTRLVIALVAGLIGGVAIAHRSWGSRRAGVDAADAEERGRLYGRGRSSRS